MVKRGERGRGEGVKGGRDSRDVGAAVVTIGYTTCVHGACRTLRHLPARTFWATPEVSVRVPHVPLSRCCQVAEVGGARICGAHWPGPFCLAGGLSGAARASERMPTRGHDLKGAHRRGAPHVARRHAAVPRALQLRVALDDWDRNNVHERVRA